MSPLESNLFKVFFGLYLASAFCYVLHAAFRTGWAARTASWLAFLGLLAHTGALLARSLWAGRVPYVTFYEFLIAFAWAMVAVYLVMQTRFSREDGDARLLGALVMPVALALVGYAAMRLPPHMQSPEKLMPVLKSYWLIFHIFTGVLGYAGAGVAFAAACAYLIKRALQGGKIALIERLPSLESLGDIEYRSVAFLFPFLTLMNITGAVWAYVAWGRYWGWDPKETWALITWLVYVFYMHARMRPAWQGKRASYVAIVGFVTVLFTFAGVSFLSVFSQSVHSYAQ